MQIDSNRHNCCQSQGFDLGPTELQILSTKDSFLNAICMNGLSNLLKALFVRDSWHHSSASRCAIFSTYDLHRIRSNATDYELWRSTRHLKFWEMDIWILPIHRRTESHWVLAVLYLQRKEVHVFDSLAGRAWNQDIKVFLTFNSSTQF